MFQQEQYNLELKESVTKTFLKTVCAYANYHNGRIVFGITDSGDVVGVSPVREEMLRIENQINDSIDPRPAYNLSIESRGKKRIVVLDVQRGKDTPCYYKGKAYKRSDTATVPVDRQELNRLVLSGMNLNYEATKSDKQDLEFKVLEKKMKAVLGIESLSLDILKTLELFSKEGYYNLAALLLSDKNDLGLPGIDMVKFGESINKFLFRGTAEGMSILSQFDYAVEIFERYYRYEEIVDFTRQEKQLIPKEAFREAIANALVHREWDVKAHIQIAMYHDRVEINSPGGLPFGMNEEDYLYEQVSILRNPIIAGVFNRLGLIERFGTGVARIMGEYQASYRKPKFKIGDRNIKVILPLHQESLPYLSADELVVYDLIRDNRELTRLEIDEKAGFNKSKTLRTINGLLEKEVVRKQGSGPGSYYTLA